MYTEDEAKKKWCPRSAHHHQMYHFQEGQPPKAAPHVSECCLGSNCMAWRWAGKTPVTERTIWSMDEDLRAEQERQEAKKLARRMNARKGYCGLAGNTEVEG